jgi:intergrase/recombinase
LYDDIKNFSNSNSFIINKINNIKFLQLSKIFINAKNKCFVNESLEETYIEPVVIPNFIYKIWKERLKENYNIEISKDILEVLIKTYYVRSTWKWQRAYKNIVNILVSKGISIKDSKSIAKRIIKIFDGSILRE